jgi:hypothetical protein
MSTHLAPEALVEYLDGTLPQREERHAHEHLAGCADCQRRFGELAQFDGFVLGAVDRDEVTDAAMFAVADRLLPQHAPRRFGRWLPSLLLAACFVAGVSAWLGLRSDPVTFACTIHRYAPDAQVRAGMIERFHLDLEVGTARWLCVLQRGADGAVTRLFPDPNPVLANLGCDLPLRGAVRVPHSELSDWEFTGTAPPRELLVVPLSAEPTAATLDALQRGFAGASGQVLAPELLAISPEARVVPFPPRR